VSTVQHSAGLRTKTQQLMAAAFAYHCVQTLAQTELVRRVLLRVTWVLFCTLCKAGLMQVEVDYQGSGSYKRKYRVREIIAKGPFDLVFKNEQVICVQLHHTDAAVVIRTHNWGSLGALL